MQSELSHRVFRKIGELEKRYEQGYCPTVYSVPYTEDSPRGIVCAWFVEPSRDPEEEIMDTVETAFAMFKAMHPYMTIIVGDIEARGGVILYLSSFRDSGFEEHLLRRFGLEGRNEPGFYEEINLEENPYGEHGAGEHTPG